MLIHSDFVSSWRDIGEVDDTVVFDLSGDVSGDDEVGYLDLLDELIREDGLRTFILEHPDVNYMLLFDDNCSFKLSPWAGYALWCLWYECILKQRLHLGGIKVQRGNDVLDLPLAGFKLFFGDFCRALMYCVNAGGTEGLIVMSPLVYGSRETLDILSGCIVDAMSGGVAIETEDWGDSANARSLETEVSRLEDQLTGLKSDYESKERGYLAKIESMQRELEVATSSRSVTVFSEASGTPYHSLQFGSVMGVRVGSVVYIKELSNVRGVNSALWAAMFKLSRVNVPYRFIIYDSDSFIQGRYGDTPVYKFSDFSANAEMILSKPGFVMQDPVLVPLERLLQEDVRVLFVIDRLHYADDMIIGSGVDRYVTVNTGGDYAAATGVLGVNVDEIITTSDCSALGAKDVREHSHAIILTENNILKRDRTNLGMGHKELGDNPYFTKVCASIMNQGRAKGKSLVDVFLSSVGGV